jgi:flavin-dependent thymidylate synthase
MNSSEAFASPAPKVALVNTFQRPLDNAVATARTCYSPRIVHTDEVGKDERARAVRDRIARETYQAGHHTTLQHSSFQFTLENVSRQFAWSFLHAHPFYNSEQVSQRYVEVGPGSVLVPRLPPSADNLFRTAAGRMMSTYHRLIELLMEPAAREYFRIFPGREKDPKQWQGAIKKKAQEIARYVLPVATYTHLYHTVNGLTLHRYHRLCRQHDVPRETELVVEAMVAEVNKVDPLFFRDIEDPLPLEETLEHQLLARLEIKAGGADARAFRDEFDASLGGKRSLLVDYSAQGEAGLASAVR